MASSNNRSHIHDELLTNVSHQYFVITLTNFPDFLHRTSHYQLPIDQQYIQERNDVALLPNRLIHMQIDDSEHHERLLYNELIFDLGQSIRVYLQRTRRSYPINIVVDLRNIRRQRHSTNTQESDVEAMGITNSSGTHEQRTVTLDDNNINGDTRNRKRFCLIIFNDPTLSELFKTKPGKGQERINPTQPPLNATSRISTATTTAEQVEEEEDDDDVEEEEEEEEEEKDENNDNNDDGDESDSTRNIGLNLRISSKLQKLVNEFMKHQRLPLSGRYYLDLTNQ
ncbi:unnamed protein product [Rotaria magnacalcarata]|uniref:Uncharacterized protein n=2 Tax=Rotaria magnacalcarata TaxID=392030 RepID=A0A816G9X7_9BILA|nr:unnamed protein product [Rotaria magnacalcarata]CAF2087056.1 unnamed protein product [Rotaria magnacalcarata]CAF3907817.1 unnamed protein product [Rotaria magnacalcarata]CAF3963448.1 unnamed protein product [Rotaria magnacalcarata]